LEEDKDSNCKSVSVSHKVQSARVQSKAGTAGNIHMREVHTTKSKN